jgi:hypothetical protein
MFCPMNELNTNNKGVSIRKIYCQFQMTELKMKFGDISCGIIFCIITWRYLPS